MDMYNVPAGCVSVIPWDGIVVIVIQNHVDDRYILDIWLICVGSVNDPVIVVMLWLWSLLSL